MPTIRPEVFFASVREWQWIKHRILADYLMPWSMRVGSTAPDIFVVDAFAGAGTYRTPTGEAREGSPVIAARQARQYQGARPSGRMRVICVERNRRLCSRLRDHMAPFGSLVTIYDGDFHDHIAQILDAIGQAPAVILLDPIGLKAITASRCRQLLQRAGKTDLFVIVHFGIVRRAAGQLLADGSANPRIKPADATTRNVDEFFGTTEWRRIALDPSIDGVEMEIAYLHLYFRSVLGDRYRFKSAYDVRADLDGPVKYWLVHASDNEGAFWLMNDAVVKVDQMLIRRKYDRPGQLPGIAESLIAGALGHAALEREEVLERDILQALLTASGLLTFHELKWELAQDHFGKVTQGTYGKAVKQLVKAGRLVREDRPAAALRDGEVIQLAKAASSPVRPEPNQQLTLFD
jgi:three-Cys-motif partner protein